MAENKIISTRTQVSTTQNAIDIFIYYVDEFVKKLSFFVSGSNKQVEGITFKQGDLGYTYENTTDIFYKDTEGNMIVVSDDSGNYEIDNEGQLIFTE